MRVGISRKSEGLAGAAELVDCAIKYGIDGIQYKTNQLVPWEFDAGVLDRVHPEARRLAEAGIVFHPGEDYDSWAASIDKVLSFAIPAGAGQVVWVFQPIAERGDTLERVAADLTRAGEAFGEHGIAFSFHNRRDSMIASHQQILALCELLDPDVCGLTYDTGHAASAKIPDIEASLVALAPYLRCVHFKDQDAAGEFCPLGTGVVDLDGALRGIAEAGFDRWLVIDEESANVDCDDACSISTRFLADRGVVSSVGS